VCHSPSQLRTRRAVSVLRGVWKQENLLGRNYSVFQPDPTLYLPRLLGAPFSSDSIADGHWPLVTAPRRSTRQLRGELAQHPVANPTAQVGLTTMSIELDLRELLPELLRYMRTLPDSQAFSADALMAWWQYMDPLAVTLTARPRSLPGGASHYAQASLDGLCGGHVLNQAAMRWRSKCNMHRESAATRSIYKVLFAGWRDRLLDAANWPGLESQDRESYVNILGAWLCEFDSKETDSPIHLSPTYWFPMSLVQLLGYDSGLRTWMMSDSTARHNQAYSYVSSDGSDPSQRKCRLSSLNEMARNDPAVQLQHFGFSANHYYPIPIPTVGQTDLEQAWRAIMVTASDILRGCHEAGMSSAPRDERMNVARHAAAPWEPRTILPLPSAFLSSLSRDMGERLSTDYYIGGGVFPVRVPPYSPEPRVSRKSPSFLGVDRSSSKPKVTKSAVVSAPLPPVPVAVTLAHAWSKRFPIPPTPPAEAVLELAEGIWPALLAQVPLFKAVPAESRTSRRSRGGRKETMGDPPARDGSSSDSEADAPGQLFTDGFPWTQESQGSEQPIQQRSRRTSARTAVSRRRPQPVVALKGLADSLPPPVPARSRKRLLKKAGQVHPGKVQAARLRPSQPASRMVDLERMEDPQESSYGTMGGHVSVLSQNMNGAKVTLDKAKDLGARLSGHPVNIYIMCDVRTKKEDASAVKYCLREGIGPDYMVYVFPAMALQGAPNLPSSYVGGFIVLVRCSSKSGWTTNTFHKDKSGFNMYIGIDLFHSSGRRVRIIGTYLPCHSSRSAVKQEATQEEADEPTLSQHEEVVPPNSSMEEKVVSYVRTQRGQIWLRAGLVLAPSEPAIGPSKLGAHSARGFQ
jgi:hypothetical protein